MFFAFVLHVIVAFMIPVLILDRGKTALIGIAAIFAIAFPPSQFGPASDCCRPTT
jgi:hypothetical protein